MRSKKRILAADAFDALELSALIFGGIGADHFATPLTECYPDPGTGSPVCILGHAGFVTETDSYTANPVGSALAAAYDGDVWKAAEANNDAVRAINHRRGYLPSARVSWREYTKETGLTRGE